MTMDIQTLTNEIRTFIEHMGFKEDIEAVEGFQGMTMRVSVRMKKDSNLLIGEYGNNLFALEHLLKKYFRQKSADDLKFTLDINDYRMKKMEDLKQDVKTAAKNVRLYKKEVPLRAMSSFERRIVHLLLAEYPDITTESIGDEPLRRVIIKPYP